MLVVPCILVTLLAGGPLPASPPSALASAVAPAASHLTFDRDGQGSSSSSSSSGASDVPHQLGFGGMIGAINLGTGVDVKYWFARFIGVDVRLLMSSPNEGIGTSGGFNYEAAPSVIAILTKPDPSKPVNFRPYVGAGVNHARAGRFLTSTGVPASGSGEQFFGGVEVQLDAVKALAISGEVVYTKRSQSLVAAGVKSGATGEVTFLFYVK